MATVEFRYIVISSIKLRRPVEGQREGGEELVSLLDDEQFDQVSTGNTYGAFFIAGTGNDHLVIARNVAAQY